MEKQCLEPRPERGVGQGTFSIPPGGGSAGGLGSTLFFWGSLMASANLPPLPLPPEKWNQLIATLKLSPQQTRIVELILRNYGDMQIATELGLKVPTVRTHLNRIFERLRIEDRGALVLMLFAASHQTAPRTPVI